MKSFLAYYHASRTRLSLTKDPPEPRSVQALESGEVVIITQVGGLHHYERRSLTSGFRYRIYPGTAVPILAVDWLRLLLWSPNLRRGLLVPSAMQGTAA